MDNIIKLSDYRKHGDLNAPMVQKARQWAMDKLAEKEQLTADEPKRKRRYNTGVVNE